MMHLLESHEHADEHNHTSGNEDTDEHGHTGEEEQEGEEEHAHAEVIQDQVRIKSCLKHRTRLNCMHQVFNIPIKALSAYLH